MRFLPEASRREDAHADSNALEPDAETGLGQEHSSLSMTDGGLVRSRIRAGWSVERKANLERLVCGPL